jgi:transcription factor MYB, plant
VLAAIFASSHLEPRSSPVIHAGFLQEDDVLRKLVEQYPYSDGGANVVDWKAVATGTGRTTKQCRERWINVLDPGISHAKWTQEELEILFHSHAELGNRWSAIAARIPGR